MEQQQSFPRFQWSLFTDAERREQLVIRCDDFGDFLEALELVKSLLAAVSSPVLAGGSPPPTNPNGAANGHVPEAAPPVASVAQTEPLEHGCPIHNQPMKLRRGKNGQEWYDHRWQENGSWQQCNGERIRTSPVKEKEGV